MRTENQLRRKIVASFVFDLGSTELAYNLPSVSIYYDVTDGIYPVQIVATQGDFKKEFKYDFSYLQIALKNGLTYMQRIAIEHIDKTVDRTVKTQDGTFERKRYEGNFLLDPEGIYLSPFAYYVKDYSKSRIDKWILKGESF